MNLWVSISKFYIDITCKYFSPFAKLLEVTSVLIATDSDEIFTTVDSILSSDTTEVSRIKEGKHAIEVVKELDPEFVLLDLQTGNMGGIASCLALRQEEASGRLPKRKIILLLDREADLFLAQQSKADDWLLKPLKPLQLRKLCK